ncbi:MAG: sulfite exporter TauE/SafE family protein [Bacillota bacterium]
MIGSLEWWGGAMVVVVATVLQSITGFGFALIAVPLFLFFFDAHTAVALNIMISFPSLVLLSLQVKEDILKPTVKTLFLGSLIGLLPGVVLFLNFDMFGLKMIISGVCLLFAGLLLANIAPRGITGPKAETLVGAVSGFLCGSVGMPGPPIVLFFNQQDMPKDKFRATTAAYFALIYPSTLIVMAATGAISPKTLYLALTLFPFTFVGKNLGFRLFPMVSQQQFQKGVPVVVILAAVYVLMSQLRL